MVCRCLGVKEQRTIPFLPRITRAAAQVDYKAIIDLSNEGIDRPPILEQKN
jgi:hypothetical protein